MLKLSTSDFNCSQKLHPQIKFPHLSLQHMLWNNLSPRKGTVKTPLPQGQHILPSYPRIQITLTYLIISIESAWFCVVWKASTIDMPNYIKSG